MHPIEMSLEITARHVLATDVVGLRLVSHDRSLLPEWRPGAHIDLVFPGEMVRQYSLCGDPVDREGYTIAVLHEAEGRGGSRHVHSALNVGDRVMTRPPRNHFELVNSTSYLFIAGGIGITPILPMVADAKARGAEWRCVYGGRRREAMAFVDVLERYGERVQVRPADQTGLLDLDLILERHDLDTQVYCCGPEALLQAVEGCCRRLGWPEGALHLERFSPAASMDTVGNQAFVIELARSGITLAVPATSSILKVLEDAGHFIPSSCGVGACGTCEVGVLAGTPLHRDSILSAEERAEGTHMMACVSRSCSERLVLDL